LGPEAPLVVAGAISWRLLVIGTVVFFGFRALVHVHVLIVPLAFALFLAALLQPVVALFEKAVPRGVAALIAVLLAIGAVAGALAFLGLRVADQFGKAGEFVDRGAGKLAALLSLDQSGLSGAFHNWFTAHRSGLASGFATGAIEAFTVGSEVLLALAFSYFMLRDGREQFERATARLDDRKRGPARGMGRRAWETLGRYLRGLSLIALANSLEKGVALLILGVPMILPVMVLTFVGSFVPFAGPILAGAIAALVALADSGVTTALLVIAAALLIQIIEGNVWQPFILGKTMHLAPVVILAVVTLGAILGGLVGAFLAVPILAAGRSALATPD